MFEADDKHIKLGGSGGKQVFEFVCCGTTDNMVKRLRLNEQHIDLMHTSMALGSLRGMLGGNWEVQTIGDFYFLNKVGNERSVVVRSQ